MNITQHFTLEEFQRSSVADAHGIDNTIPAQYIPTLEQLCRTILEPLRAFAGQPIIISPATAAQPSTSRLEVSMPASTPWEKPPTLPFPKPTTPLGLTANATPTWKLPTVGSPTSRTTPTSTSSSWRPPTATTTGSTSPAARTARKTDTKCWSWTRCRE